MNNRNMVTNDDADDTENHYPIQNQMFTRRPVDRERFCLIN